MRIFAKGRYEFTNSEGGRYLSPLLDFDDAPDWIGKTVFFATLKKAGLLEVVGAQLDNGKPAAKISKKECQKLLKTAAEKGTIEMLKLFCSELGVESPAELPKEKYAEAFEVVGAQLDNGNEKESDENGGNGNDAE